MLAAGWLDEVEKLVAGGFGGWLTSTQAIGYAELARHLAGELEPGGRRPADRHSGPAISRDGRWRGSAVTRGSGGSTPASEGAASIVDELVAYLEGA